MPSRQGTDGLAGVNDQFRGCRAFISGGSSGIGKETARALIEAGASVAIAARGEERLAATVDELRRGARRGQQVLAMPLDVRDAEATLHVASQVREQLSGVDLVISNAGRVRPGRFDELDLGVFRDTMASNYLGAVHVTRGFLPLLHAAGASGKSHISFVSSMLGFMGLYGYTSYAASKYAVVGFAESLRQELLGSGVSVSILYPPDTATPQLDEELLHRPEPARAVAGNRVAAQPQDVARAYLKGIATGRLHILPGFDAAFTHHLCRVAPGLVRWVIDRSLRKARGRGRA